MTSVALKMLFGDRAKVIGLVMGVALCTLLIQQQMGLFIGLMLRSQNLIAETHQAQIWVMDPATEYVDLARPLRDVAVYQVRGVAGVDWAVPFFKASAPIKTADGRVINGMLLGVDDASLIGTPQRFLLGSPADLRRPDAIAIDRVGYSKIWPDEPVRVGRILELNDQRAVITAISDARPAFATQVIIHTLFGRARSYLGTGRKQLPFVLVGVAEGSDPAQIARAISARTGLKALTSAAFARQTVNYYLRKTGIPINFATTVMLGLAVGAAIVGLTFHSFVSDNLKQFATLKIIGMRDLSIARMVLLQVSVTGLFGFSIGTWLAAAFFNLVSGPTSALRGMFLPWWITVGAAGVVLVVIVLSTALSLKRVLSVDPARVLRS